MLSLSLISAEAVVIEVRLRRLTPLLLLLLLLLWLLMGTAATVSAGTAGLLHLLVSHTRVAKSLLLLGKRLSAGAGSCPRIRLFVSILQLPPVPLT